MSQPPIFYVITGFIPGLGFLLIGEKKRFFSTLFVIVILIIVVLLPLPEEIRFMGGMIAVLFWFWSLVFTYQLASKKEAEELGVSTIKDVRTVPIPIGTSVWSQDKYVVSGMLQAHLEESDRLLESIKCHKKFILNGIFKTYHVGITKKHLAILELDLGGKPYKFEKYPIDQIEWVKLRKKFLDPGRLMIQLSTETRPRKWEISPGFGKTAHNEFKAYLAEKSIVLK